MLNVFQNESPTTASEYSLTDMQERMYQNQLALEAALLEITLWAEQQNAVAMGTNVRGGTSHYW